MKVTHDFIAVATMNGGDNGQQVKPVVNGDVKHDEESPASHVADVTDRKDRDKAEDNKDGEAAKTEDNAAKTEEKDGEAAKTEDSAAKSEEKDGEADKTEDAPAEGQDIILIQDTGFIVQIQAPGLEPFDLPVSA